MAIEIDKSKFNTLESLPMLEFELRKRDVRLMKELKDLIINFIDTYPVKAHNKNLIKKDPELPAEDKEKALALLHQDTVEMQEVSKRWQADMKSDSWLSKNTRPLTLVFLTVSMVLLIFIDSTGIDFEVDSGWVDLLKSLLITVYVAYFGSRGAEKFKTIQNKN